jgi:hypothetical protein
VRHIPQHLGLTANEFNSVRAALFALASFCNGMHRASATEREISANPKIAAKFHAEFLEWNTPIPTTGFVFTRLIRATRLSQERMNDILLPLMLDALAGDFANAGDGYLPPLIRLDQDSFLFNPHALRFMMHERNLLYVTNKRHRERFDNVVSQHLEPMLLNEAILEFRRIPTWLVEKNVVWSHGEVDLLVFTLARMLLCKSKQKL